MVSQDPRESSHRSRASKSLGDLDFLLPLENRGAELLIAQTDLCPAMVIRARSKDLRLFAGLETWGLGGPTHAAVPIQSGIEILPTESGECAIESARHAEPWILCWFEGAQGWDQLRYGQPCHWRGHHPEKPFPHVDVPWLIVLQRRAERIELGKDGLTFAFNTDPGNIVVMPLFGTDFPDVEQTQTWREGLPDRIRERCRRWSRFLRHVPVACHETFTIDEKNDVVAINQTFDYLAIEDDWQTPGEYIAPYPPFALLAAQSSGFPIVFEEMPEDDELATLYGPYGFRRGAQSSRYQLRGLLKYVLTDETYPEAPCTPAAERALERLRLMLASDPRLAAKTSGGYTRGLALALASYAHALRYLNDEQKSAIRDIMSELAERVLDPSNYMPLIRYEGGGKEGRLTTCPTSASARKAYGDSLTTCPTEPVGEAICQRVRDAYKVVQANLFGLWATFETTGEWEQAREAWPLIRRWFHLPYQTQWLSPLPARWEGLDIARALFDGTIGYARLAARVGASEDYRLACYLFAKVCAGWFAMEQMRRYMRAHQPWLFNTDADFLIWHPCGLNGYVLIANDHLLPNEQGEVDGRGWASAYGRMTPTNARFWRDFLRGHADELLHQILPRCRPDWAKAGAPAVTRSYVLGESPEQLEQDRTADEAAEETAGRDPLRLRTWHLFQSTPVLKELAIIEAGAEPSSVRVVPGVPPMPQAQEGAGRTAGRMEQAAMPARIEWSGENSAYPLLFWPGVKTPQKPFAVLDERLDVLPFGGIQWPGLSARKTRESPTLDEQAQGEKSDRSQETVLGQSRADSLRHFEGSAHEIHHPNWCLTLFTCHEEVVEAIDVQRRSDDAFLISWSTPVPADSLVQYWQHDLVESRPPIETVKEADFSCDHKLIISLSDFCNPKSKIQNRKSEIFLFRVLSFDKSGRLYRSRVTRLPTRRTNWALGCTAYVSKRFPFKEFKYAPDREAWLQHYRSEGKPWNVLKPPHELTDGQGLRPGVEPWIRHAEGDPSYVHWIAIDLGQPRPVDEVVIAHDPGWTSAGCRIEAGPGDEPWSASLGDPSSDRWNDLLAEETENRTAISRHTFACRPARWVRIVYTRPAPLGLAINRVALWEIEVRGPVDD